MQINKFFTLLIGICVTPNANVMCADTVVGFYNPCYSEYSDTRVAAITNGSILGYAASGPIGTTIRAAQSVNDIKNPLGLTHIALAILEDPAWIYYIVAKKMRKTGNDRGLSETAGTAILNELRDNYKERIAATYWSEEYKTTAPFTLEADGSAKELLHGIYPYVHIHNLKNSLLNYSGNVYLRTLNQPIATDQTRAFIKLCFGKKYESLLGISELIRATQDKNQSENTKRFFCSELAAYFYASVDVIPHINASNITPECFGSAAGIDLLRERASDEIALKYAHSFNERNIQGTSLWGHLTQSFVKFFNWF